MALKTKIKLTPAYDWKSLLIEDITGTGITGYGANQDLIGYRELNSITRIIIELTTPSGIPLTPIKIEGSDLATFKLTLNYTITNLDLNYVIDETLEEGIWKIVYTPFFTNPNSVGLTITSPISSSLTYDSLNKLAFTNATKLVYTISGEVYYNILSNVLGPTISTLITDNVQSTSINGSDYEIGLGTTTYTAFTKEIKECLDNKVADESLCECECTDCELVKKYLLYDAIYLNCLQNNATKAQQIFDYLTKFCNHCGC
jgi:hypothetical protein